MNTQFKDELDKAISIADGQSQLARVISDLTENPKFTQSHVWRLRERDNGVKPELAVKLVKWARDNGEELDLYTLSPRMDWELTRELLA